MLLSQAKKNDYLIIFIMKNAFYCTVKLVYRVFFVFCILFFIISCNTKSDPPKLVFNLDSRGSEIVASFEDDTPQVVFFYDVDETGIQTQERIGVAEFYPNKQERLGGALKNGEKEGQWYAFFSDGSVQTDAFYLNGKEHGNYNVYRENGNPLFKGHYNHGICDGTWYWFNENGKQIRKVKADNKTIACEYCKKCLTLKANQRN